MGWTGSQYYGKDRKEFLIQEFTQENATHKWYLTDISMRGSVAYCISWAEDKLTGKKEHEGYVILTEKNRKEPNWIYYKEMGETVLPYYFNAPVSLIKKLNALGEPYNDMAKQWREQCLTNASKTKLKLEFGQTIKFSRALRFGSSELDTFTYTEYGNKRNIFKSLDGMLVRIPKWQTREFEVVNV